MDYLCDSINALFKSLMFPNSLKLAVTPLHKKGRKVLKEDYRSVSILSTLCLPKYLLSLTMFPQIITVDFGKAIVLNSAISKC